MKIGNYRKLNESEYDNDDHHYALEVYGEMNIAGSYNGLEHWWLVVSDNEDYDLGTYIEAIKEIISNFESEYSYAYIDPKTQKVVDSNGIDYYYLADKMMDGNTISIKCSYEYENDEFDLSNITKNDCKDGLIIIKWADYDEFKRCENDGAITEI